MFKPELIFISGSMFGKKSKKLIDIIKVAQEQRCKYVVLKPTNDTRDGLFIKSRDYDEAIPAEPWDINDSNKFNKLLKMIQKFGLTIRPKMIFIDEVHFLPVEDIEKIYRLCQAKRIMLIASGLETDFKMKTFPTADFLKGHATYYQFNKGTCNNCGEETAVYNILFDEQGNVVKEGKTIQPGNEEYEVRCKKCVKLLH